MRYRAHLSSPSLPKMFLHGQLDWFETLLYLPLFFQRVTQAFMNGSANCRTDITQPVLQLPSDQQSQGTYHPVEESTSMWVIISSKNLTYLVYSFFFICTGSLAWQTLCTRLQWSGWAQICRS